MPYLVEHPPEDPAETTPAAIATVSEIELLRQGLIV